MHFKLSLIASHSTFIGKNSKFIKFEVKCGALFSGPTTLKSSKFDKLEADSCLASQGEPDCH